MTLLIGVIFKKKHVTSKGTTQFYCLNYILCVNSAKNDHRTPNQPDNLKQKINTAVKAFGFIMMTMQNLVQEPEERYPPEKHVTTRNSSFVAVRTFHSLISKNDIPIFLLHFLLGRNPLGKKMTHLPDNLAKIQKQKKHHSWNWIFHMSAVSPLGNFPVSTRHGASLWGRSLGSSIWESQHTLVVPMMRMPMAVMVRVVTPRNVGIVQELLQIWRKKCWKTWKTSDFYRLFKFRIQKVPHVMIGSIRSRAISSAGNWLCWMILQPKKHHGILQQQKVPLQPSWTQRLLLQRWPVAPVHASGLGPSVAHMAATSGPAEMIYTMVCWRYTPGKLISVGNISFNPLIFKGTFMDIRSFSGEEFFWVSLSSWT